MVFPCNNPSFPIKTQVISCKISSVSLLLKKKKINSKKEKGNEKKKEKKSIFSVKLKFSYKNPGNFL